MNSIKKTLILGASHKPERASYEAAIKLQKKGYEFEMVGNKEAEVAGKSIIKGTPFFDDIHTVTLYLNALNQKEYYSYILSLKPNRIIFNPGAENEELKQLATKNGIETEEACTLVMLSIGHF